MSQEGWLYREWCRGRTHAEAMQTEQVRRLAWRDAKGEAEAMTQALERWFGWPDNRDPVNAATYRGYMGA